MERVVAIKKLGRILGKSLGYRVDPRAPSREEREEAQRQLPDINAAKQRARDMMLARREALLASDQQYQELVAAYEDAKKRAERTFSISRHYKFVVGTTNSMFFHIKAEGDSWEEVIEKLSTKAVA